MTDAQGPFFQEGDTGKPTGATAVTAFAYTQATMFADIVRRLQNQHRSALWYKGLNADLLDSKHAAYLTTAVNETDVDHPDLNDTDPAAPTGGLNVKWQVSATQNSDDQTPVSAYVPFSSLAVVTIVSTDYVVITDTSDSNNPKRALVSDITALVTVPTAASTTEVLTGTDAAKFVTPDALAALWEQGGDLASAGTVLVPEGGYYHITGTTTITDIDLATNKAGRKFWFVFDGVLTLTHNATTLILPSGANITTAAGDAACFVSEGGDNVRCVAYLRASGAALVASSGLGDPGGNGLVVRTALNTTTNRTLTGSGLATISNGDGVGGNPTVIVPAASTTEQLTGTDATKAATPDSVAALWEQGSDIASANTISVGEGGYFNVTGTTDISDIDFATDKAGRKVWLKFTDSVEIAHNASTLILPTGANIATAAGDTACFISEGADAVRCVVYQRADGSSLAGGGGGISAGVSAGLNFWGAW